MEPPVVVFTTSGCQYCRRAKEALAARGVAYAEVSVADAPELRAVLREATGSRTVPQVYVHGELVGGSDDLAAAMQGGAFDALLARASAAALPPALAEAVAAADAAAAAAAQAAAAAEPESGASAAAAAEAAALAGLAAELAAPPPAGIARGTLNPAPLGGRSEPSAFTGAALVDWLVARAGDGGGIGGGGAGAREAALRLAQRLVDANLVNVVSERRPAAAEGFRARDEAGCVLRLRADADVRVPYGAPLNTHYWWAGPARPAEQVAEALRAAILKLYDAHLSADGRAVDYKGIAPDPAFRAFVDASAELQAVDLAPLDRAALTALAINLYNAAIIHAFAVHGTEAHANPVTRGGFFSKGAAYVIGGAPYSADDLENGVLRGNRPPAAAPGMLLGVPWLSRGPFRSGDPRAAHVVDPPDARIHFALVCGGKGCPPIKLYSAATLEEGLAAAGEAFCASEVEVDRAGRRVTMSKIFKWYYPDFGSSKAERLAWVLPFLGGQARADLEALLAEDPGAGGIRVQYKEYDWAVNEA